MPRAKTSKSPAAKRNLGKAKMKGTKGGIIAVLIGKSSPATNVQSSQTNGLLLPAVKTGFCDGSV
jgi:hypothetical protein